MGLISPSSGEINVLGLSLKKHKYKILNKINFQSPYVELPKKMSVYQNLLFYSRLYNVYDYKVLIKNLSRELFIDELLDLSYGKLSSGQKTRVNLCKALLNNPDLLLLDEPTASLDIQTSEFIREYLIDYQKKKNSAILITSHNLEEISFMCNYLIIFDNGEVKVQGDLKNILKKRKLKELIFND
jgi:ABC-2 type transport system ATP-binding protein